MAVWMPRSRQAPRNAAAKAGWASGSPPERVTPPPDSSKKTRSFSISAINSLSGVAAAGHLPRFRHADFGAVAAERAGVGGAEDAVIS